MMRAEGVAKSDVHAVREPATRRTFGSREYVWFVLGALLFTFVFAWRHNGIFACPGGGYHDGYLAYCQADAYADYDHGAIWFALEPEVVRRAGNASVLFIGNSRLQFALSTAVTTNWFANLRTSYYLLGFGQTENAQFVAPLLDRIEPHAKVYVVNVDRFFDSQLSQPAAAIMTNADALDRYRTKRRWQPLHELICDRAPALCGNHVAFYRSRENGAWTRRGTESQFRTTAVEDAPTEDPQAWIDYVDIARGFVGGLPVAKACVVLTLAPYHRTKRREAAAIADALGLPLISPQLHGLTTFDGSHLDPDSAQRWSEAFFAAAGPAIHRCVAPATAGAR